MLTRAPSYDEVCRALRWRLPEFFNMGVDVCDKHADATPQRTALIVVDEDGDVTAYSFLALKMLSNKLANLLVAKGLAPGERIGILLSQSVETAIAHIAAWKVGCVSIPLFTLFGEDALEYRLANSGARVLVTDAANAAKVDAMRDRLPHLQHLLVTDAAKEGGGIVDLWRALEAASDDFTPVRTRAEDPALIIYTSGTTGNPKGALHAHRVLLGHLPGVEFPHEFFPREGDLMWTPADWAWIGGLMNVLMSSWHHGVPVLAYRARKYDPEDALRLMAEHGVRNTFMPPTALRLMRQVPDIAKRFTLSLRTVTCAGEPMGAELLEWGRETFGITLNEYYGQTECNLVVANCAALMEVRPGSMGRAVPGHQVEIIDEEGAVMAPNALGRIAVRRPDPVMFLQYWDDADATRRKFIGDWLVTGDQGCKDEEGYLWFLGRDDDVITSAGYRIGPGEIEDCLGKHPAVSMAAVVGVPDRLRTEAVKAFVLLRPGVAADEALENDIRAFVKTRLSSHEYPRLIEFVDSLPMTTTGKIRRLDLRNREPAEPDG
ncbi:MAG: acyl-CoA synthetase [Rhodospirillales bacterium]|jgi:acetyl-CoA synthetase|nr:acyl-CoA synthetase [Rhodospirillales bacterium]MDP6788779.1 acyl-CoA synthetase [Rhodospirillales bacterium]